MPRRVIDDGIHTGKRLNALTDFQFRVWAYLLTYVDDYGRGSADPEILKGFLFPRRKGITESSIKQSLADLANAGLIRLYAVNGEPHLYFPDWQDYQRIQRKYSKFPAPPDENEPDKKSTVNHGESRWITVNHGGSPLELEQELELELEVEVERSMRARAQDTDKFNEFWDIYPKKVAKKAAHKAYLRLKPSEKLHSDILADLQKRKVSRQWTDENGRFIPNAATYLNGRRWEDEDGEAHENAANKPYTEKPAVCGKDRFGNTIWR